MYFGKRSLRDRERFPASLKKQLMLQGIFLFLVLGILLVSYRWYRGGGDFPDHLSIELPIAPPPPPRGQGDGESTGDDDLDDLDDLDVELVRPVDPAPFVENPQLLLETAVREARGELHTDSMLHLFHKVRTRKGGLPALEPVLSALRGDLVWSALIDHPNQYRGKLVEVRGELVARHRDFPALDLDREALFDFPNPAGVPSSYRGYLYDDRQKFFLLSTWKKGRLHRDRENVIFRGFFCQLYTYHVTFQGVRRKARIPLVVGENFQVVPPLIEPQDLTPLYFLLIVLPLVAGGVIFLVSWSSDRSYRTRMAAVRRKRFAKKLQKKPQKKPEEDSAEKPEDPSEEKPEEKSGDADGPAGSGPAESEPPADAAS
ncbi:MAG: hypothetical protein O7J95_12070 [Planctomycetota bacterium]|nr:hypothetical protein [Planctomycetota bacterium]